MSAAPADWDSGIIKAGNLLVWPIPGDPMASITAGLTGNPEEDDKIMEEMREMAWSAIHAGEQRAIERLGYECDDWRPDDIS